MTYEQLILDDVPELSAETAIQLIDSLYALAGALENRYFAQIHQERESHACVQYDLFQANPDPNDFDDPLPDF
jgi:hypothetical protein